MKEGSGKILGEKRIGGIMKKEGKMNKKFFEKKD